MDPFILINEEGAPPLPLTFLLYTIKDKNFFHSRLKEELSGNFSE